MKLKLKDIPFIKKNKAKIKKWIIPWALFTLYLGGIIAQYTSSGNLTGKTEVSFNPFKCIAANFTVSIAGLLLLFALYLCFAGYLYLKYKDSHALSTEQDDRGFLTENSGIYGTASLLKPDEVKNFCEVEPLERTKGIILGKFVDNDPSSTKKIISVPPDGKRFKYDEFGRIAVETKNIDGVMKRVPVRERLKVNTNRHIMVTGASGCGKSYCFARPAILQSIKAGESIIITDPKGELYSDTSLWAQKHGYTVKIFNLSYLQGSDSWDALKEIKSSQDIQIEAQNFCNIIIENTINPGGKSDESFMLAEKNLLTAIVLHIATCSYLKEEERTLGRCYDFLLQTDEEMDAAIRNEGNSVSQNPALLPWSQYFTGSQNLKGNVKSGLGSRLQVLQSEVVKDVTGIPDIDLELPGKTKCAYYVIMDDMNSTFKFLSSLFFACLFAKLVNYSRQQESQALPVTVNVVMDEFIAIGKIPDFDKKLATVRSAHINIIMIFQSLTQLQAAYPMGLWETLIANCSTFVCLACNDMTTAEYISKRSGTSTVLADTTRQDRPLVSIGYIPEKISHSYGYGKREVLQPAEVINLASKNKVIVAVAGADIFICDKFPYTDMIDPSILVQQNMYDYSPTWAQVKTQKAANQFAGRNHIDDVLHDDIVGEYKPKYGDEDYASAKTAAQEADSEEADKLNDARRKYREETTMRKAMAGRNQTRLSADDGENINDF